MHGENKGREARMMERIAGLGGRSALSGEVDLRLGLTPVHTGNPGWMAAIAGRLRRSALRFARQPRSQRTAMDRAEARQS